MPGYKDLEKSMGLDKGGKGQQYIDEFVFEHSKKYLPGIQRIHIYQDSVAANKFGSGKVIWNTPDANYLYEGKLMVDALTHSAWGRFREQKIMDPQGRNLHYNEEPQRGAKWFDRMIDAEMSDLMDGVEHIVKGDK